MQKLLPTTARTTGQNVIIHKKYQLLAAIAIVLLSFIGLAILYSIEQASQSEWALKQLYVLIGAVGLMFFCSKINGKWYYRYAYGAYFIVLILLILAHFIGYKAMGAQRWIRVGGFNLQPSELMKVVLVLALARFYHNQPAEICANFKTHMIPIILIALPAFITLKQPNLGTATVICLLGGIMIFSTGIKWQIVAATGALGVGLGPVMWHFMHDYQKQRVLTFLDPSSDSLGSGYNIIQSMIAIGSGDLFGKGFMEGSQNKLNFLPERQTDFIFSVLAEEFGFMGVIITLMLTVAVVFFMMRLSLLAQTQFGRLIILGMTSLFAIHIIINTAMISGLMPVVGMPFPLLSYGGSNLLSMLLGFGIALNPSVAGLKDR